MTPIDLLAPWQLANACFQRESPGRGRYRVEATFITGCPPDYQYCSVNYWLPETDGHDSHVAWMAYREIVNSHLHPSTFEGLELPTKEAA